MPTCKRDVVARDRDETETFEKYVSRPSRDRDVETETTTLIVRDGRNVTFTPKTVSRPHRTKQNIQNRFAYFRYFTNHQRDAIEIILEKVHL